MIKYDKLWETMKNKGVTKYALCAKYNMGKAQLKRLNRGQGITTHTIDRLCNILECRVEDIMEHFPDDNVY